MAYFSNTVNKLDLADTHRTLPQPCTMHTKYKPTVKGVSKDFKGLKSYRMYSLIDQTEDQPLGLAHLPFSAIREAENDKFKGRTCRARWFEWKQSIPHSTLSISLPPNSIWTDFISQTEMGRKQIFFNVISRRVGLFNWVFWARINITSWGALWHASVVGFATPPASWGKAEKSATVQKQVYFCLSPSHWMTYSQPGATCNVGKIDPIRTDRKSWHFSAQNSNAVPSHLV